MLLQFAAYFVYYTDLTLNPNIIIKNKVCDLQNKISKALVQVFAFYRISRILDYFFLKKNTRYVQRKYYDFRKNNPLDKTAHKTIIIRGMSLLSHGKL